MLGTRDGVVDPVLQALSLYSQSQGVLLITYPGLLGDGEDDEGGDEAVTVIDSVAPLWSVSSRLKWKYGIRGFPTLSSQVVKVERRKRRPWKRCCLTPLVRLTPLVWSCSRNVEKRPGNCRGTTHTGKPTSRAMVTGLLRSTSPGN